MKIRIIICLILPMFLFSLMGCDCSVRRAWTVEIVNELSYPIYATIIFKLNSEKKTTKLIQPEESDDVVRINVRKDIPSEAHAGIKKISVFLEDNTPFMVLEGEGIDEYVIFMGKDKYDDYLFYFEVKEEYLGIGLDKRIEFEEELEKKTESETEDEFFEDEIESELEDDEVGIDLNEPAIDSHLHGNDVN